LDDNTNSDVERALETFGGSSLKYRSFGTFALRPTTSPAAPPAPATDDEGDAGIAQLPSPATFPAGVPPAAPLPVMSRPTAEHHADTLYPLLGAALPEASAVQVQPAGKRNAGDARLTVPEPAVPPASYVPRQGRPATAYVHPTMPSPSVPSPGTPNSGLADTVPPPLVAVPPAPPVRPVLSTPVAERGWVPPPVAPEPMPAPIPPQPVIAAPSSVAPEPAPTIIPAPPAAVTPRGEVVVPAEAPAAAPVVALASHFEANAAAAEPTPPSSRSDANGHVTPRSSADAADHRSLAEMFRVLSGSAEPPRPPAAPFARPGHDEPGLFRRL